MQKSSNNIISKLLLFFFVGLALLPSVVLAENKMNAGFVTGLWYSKTPFFAGEKIRIYSVIQNQSNYDLVGTIQFIDNNKIIGEKNFSTIKGNTLIILPLHLIQNFCDVILCNAF